MKTKNKIKTIINKCPRCGRFMKLNKELAKNINVKKAYVCMHRDIDGMPLLYQRTVPRLTHKEIVLRLLKCIDRNLKNHLKKFYNYDHD